MTDEEFLCPSADASWPGARVVGVVLGEPDEPRVGYLAHPVPLTSELIAQTEPAGPGRLLRLAAPCAQGGCGHFQSGRCRLARNLVEFLPSVISDLPVCAIRSTCRWWRQEGRDACLRCPQVQTDQDHPTEMTVRAATTDLEPK